MIASVYEYDESGTMVTVGSMIGYMLGILGLMELRDQEVLLNCWRYHFTHLLCIQRYCGDVESSLESDGVSLK